MFGSPAQSFYHQLSIVVVPSSAFVFWSLILKITVHISSKLSKHILPVLIKHDEYQTTDLHKRLSSLQTIIVYFSSSWDIGNVADCFDISCLLWELLMIIPIYALIFSEIAGQINVRKYRRGNKKRTIQKNWQHRVQKTKKKKKQKQSKNTTQYLQHGLHKNRGWAQVLAKGKQFLACYSYIKSSTVQVLAVIRETKHLRKN